jgi:hypothetical protein
MKVFLAGEGWRPIHVIQHAHPRPVEKYGPRESKIPGQ